MHAGMWSAVVIGTHPIEANQEVWLEISIDDEELGPLPAYWLENKGPNSFWHVPIPPQSVGARLRYRSAARQNGSTPVYSYPQEMIVRPNLPDRTESAEITHDSIEGLTGNRMMTIRVDNRGTTYDVYFPTVGLHSDVRPAEGDRPRSRSHFRSIVAGIAAGERLDWFNETAGWDAFQYYQGATNVLVTELKWRRGPIRVLASDYAVMGPDLPRTAAGSESPGQYIKSYRIINKGAEPLKVIFGLYVQAEVNGGIGEPGLSWQDVDRTLLAINRGHAHSNRKLARDATVEFAIALDGGDVQCEPTGPDEAIMLRRLELPVDTPVTVNVLVSGAFTGWRGDTGTFEHWLRPALAWFRAADLEKIEASAAHQWDAYVEPLPELNFPRPVYAVSLRRSALAAALHADAKWGAIASGYDRGLSAYCWPRDAVRVGGMFDRVGHPEIGRSVLEWLARVRGKNRPYSYWFQKYSIDGWPEWETPAIDQTAIIPWGLNIHYRRTGDADFLAANWPLLEQAASVCSGASGHPGLRFLADLSLVTSAGLWDQGFGAFLYSNSCVVAGLRAAAEIALFLDKNEHAERWFELAEKIWNVGILKTIDRSADVSARLNPSPGLVDAKTGRFLEARRLSNLTGLWSDKPEHLIDAADALDISLLGPCVPFDLLPATDPRVRATADEILKRNAVGGEGNVLTRWAPAAERGDDRDNRVGRRDASCLATLWMSRYLIRLGRETGQGRYWSRAVALLDNMLGRLGPLSLSVRLHARRSDDLAQSFGPDSTSRVWGLHAQLIETMLDFLGLEYDAVDRTLTLEPSLPPAWPSIGVTRPLPCGKIDFRLDRSGSTVAMAPAAETVSASIPASGHAPSRRLRITARMKHIVKLKVSVACSDIDRISCWQATPQTENPQFTASTRKLSWNVELPEGESVWEWSWS